MSSKLNEIFKINEAVIDSNAPATGSPQKSLKMFGINKNEIKTTADLKSAFSRWGRVTASALAALTAKAGSGGVAVPDVNPALRPLLEKLSNLIVEVVNTPTTDPAKVQKAEPKSQEHPATGYSDDPNPETRNTKFPNRSYRAG